MPADLQTSSKPSQRPRTLYKMELETATSGTFTIWDELIWVSTVEVWSKQIRCYHIEMTMFEDICSRMLMILTLSIEHWTIISQMIFQGRWEPLQMISSTRCNCPPDHRSPTGSTLSPRGGFQTKTQAFPIKTLTSKLKGREFFYWSYIFEVTCSSKCAYLCDPGQSTRSTFASL